MVCIQGFLVFYSPSPPHTDDWQCSGNFPIPEKNHTLIVGHNQRQLVHVVRELFSTRYINGQKGGLVAVLSPQSENGKSELDKELLEHLGPENMAQVVTRVGTPLQIADLALVRWVLLYLGNRNKTIISQYMPSEH